MSHRILRLNDGFDHTSPELRDQVKVLQTELNQGTSHRDASQRASGPARYPPKEGLGGG
jgi:hypothetical protein